MPSFLTDTHVEITRDRVDALPAHQLAALERRAGKAQPEVVGFVIGFTSELRPDVAALALYLMTTLVEMFTTAPVKRLIKVRDSTIMRHWQANVGYLRALVDGVAEHPTLRALSLEPAAFDYVTEIVFEDPRLDGSLHLDGEEAALVTIILKTAIDAMHDACRA